MLNAHVVVFYNGHWGGVLESSRGLGGARFLLGTTVELGLGRSGLELGRFWGTWRRRLVSSSDMVVL